MASKDRATVGAGWAERSFGCELGVDMTGQRWEDFTHAIDEVVLVLEA